MGSKQTQTKQRRFGLRLDETSDVGWSEVNATMSSNNKQEVSDYSRQSVAGCGALAPFKDAVGCFVQWSSVRLLIRLASLSNELMAIKLLKSLTFQRAPQWTLIPWDGPLAPRP